MSSDAISGNPFVRLVEGIRDHALFMLDLDGRVTSWNSGAQRILGDSFDEIVGEHFSRFFTADDKSWGKPQEELRIAASEGRCDDAGWRIRHDGRQFWAFISINALRDGGGKASAFAIVMRDMTERHLAEQEVRDSEARLRNIVNHAVDGILTIDEDGLIESLNPAAERIFGYSSDEIIGRNVKLLMPNPYHDEHDQYLANYRRTGQRKIIGIGREVLGRRRDGTSFPMDLAVSEVKLGQRRLFTGIVRDITERKRAEQALRDSEARHRSILETAVDGIITIDERGHIESVNPATERLFGYSAAEMVGHNVKMLMPSPYREEHDQYLDNYARTGVRKIIGIGREVFGQKKDGTVFPMDLAVSELHIGGRRMYTGLVHDVTDRKHAEQERDRLLESERAARAEAERASRAKDEFIAVLSHELRTPLTPALLTLSLLVEEPALPTNLRDDLEVIRRNVELEARLIDDLLDLTRIASGKLVITRETTDVHLLIHNAQKICEKSCGVEVALNLSAPRHHVHADPARLQQIFWNLLNNAYKFTPIGGTISITSSNPDPDRVSVSIKDTGRGIDPALMPRIFNAFEQGDMMVARRFGGLGLGLAISRAIIEAHGGSITASSPGKGMGSEFVVKMATAPVAFDFSAPAAPLQTAASPRKARILLVEDHEPTLRVMSRVLKHLGHDVTMVMGVAAALRAATEAQFDLLISDIGLPDGTGYDIMRELRRLRPDIKGIAVSGYGMADDVSKSLSAGFAQHVTKPVDLQQISAIVAHVAG